jgi:hypothetical protein
VASFRDPLQIDAVRGLDADAAVTMLNLIKFRARSLDGDWDYAALVWYPRPAAFLCQRRSARRRRRPDLGAACMRGLDP